MTDNLNKTLSCAELLPQDPRSIIRDIKSQKFIIKLLTEFIKLLKLSLHEFFLTRNFLLFDPHVGETDLDPLL